MSELSAGLLGDLRATIEKARKRNHVANVEAMTALLSTAEQFVYRRPEVSRAELTSIAQKLQEQILGWVKTYKPTRKRSNDSEQKWLC